MENEIEKLPLRVIEYVTLFLNLLKGFQLK
jgi:hypothetical protein